MHHQFFDQDFILDGRRALFWKQKKWLLLADAHWGKTHFFQKHGLSVGHGVLKADLIRLGQLIKDYNPEMVICLGDLIHHEHSLGPSLSQEIANFRNRFPVPMTLIRGNHERFIKNLPESFGIEVVDEKISVNGITLCHEEEQIEEPQLYGHLHPKLTLKGQGDFLSLPCFFQKRDHFILPAFSDFCGGKAIDLEKNQRAFVCSYDSQKNESNVFPFP